MLKQQGVPYCLATIIAEVGSVPRSSGAKMVITAQGQYDTLGGGNLEQQVIQTARAGLTERTQWGHPAPAVDIERYSMAADLAQCCGGAVQVLFEYTNLHPARVAIFGAGHVCQALAPIVAQLPCHLTVFDARASWLEPLEHQGIQTQCLASSIEMIEALLPGTYLVIMTHDHTLDYELTRLALEKQIFPYVGLIGSAGKKQRFTYRLKEQLSCPEQVDQLVCPIGHPQIKGKLPVQVAISIAAQLNIRLEQDVQHPQSEATTVAQPGQTQQSLQQVWQKARAVQKDR
jgi:xanthine dehydrogenase accessory factor